jgi:hypothetical protein
MYDSLHKQGHIVCFPKKQQHLHTVRQMDHETYCIFILEMETLAISEVLPSYLNMHFLIFFRQSTLPLSKYMPTFLS